MLLNRTAWSSVALAALVTTMSCKDSTSPTNDIRSYITNLSASGGGSASFHAGSPPAAGSGPVAVVSGSSAMILGGGALRTVSSSTAFTRIIVAIDGVDGYWELSVPSTTSQGITLSLAQEVPTQTFTVQYGAGTSAAVGAFDTEPVNIITVGTGDVQVSVTWDAASDVDLHVVEPGGEEIYWANSSAASGGELDLDSNPACAIDGKNNENITYPNVTPPHGTYTVRVDYYDSCDVTQTKYLVTIRVKGHAAVTYSGTFTGTGDSGAEGSGVQVGTFTY